MYCRNVFTCIHLVYALFSNAHVHYTKWYTNETHKTIIQFSKLLREINNYMRCTYKITSCTNEDFIIVLSCHGFLT